MWKYFSQVQQSHPKKMVRHFHIFWQRGPGGILDDTTHRNAWCNSETIEFQHPQQQILSSSLPPSYISMHWLSLPLQCPLRLFLSIINLRSSRSTARTTLFPWWFFEKGLSESGCTYSKYSKRSSRWEQTFKQKNTKFAAKGIRRRRCFTHMAYSKFYTVNFASVTFLMIR